MYQVKLESLPHPSPRKRIDLRTAVLFCRCKDEEDTTRDDVAVVTTAMTGDDVPPVAAVTTAMTGDDVPPVAAVKVKSEQGTVPVYCPDPPLL